MTNQTTRVLELLKRFNNNQKVCISSLQQEYLWEGKSEKTIRRDLDVIKSIFPESFELVRGDKGCYKALTKKSFESFLTPQNISLLIQTFNIAQRSNSFDNFDIDSSDRVIIESKLKESKKIYEFKNKPFESALGGYKLFHELEESIYHQKSIILKYEIKDGILEKEVKPYKILFMNENFYLSGEVKEDYLFSLFRVSKIRGIQQTNKTFHKNPEIEDFIADIQTPFPRYQPNYKNHLVDVLIEVDASKAFYFKNKHFLKSQQIIKEKEDGYLLISYKVTQDLEMEALIKQWIPFVKVIKPESLKKKIEDDLKQYLSQN